MDDYFAHVNYAEVPNWWLVLDPSNPQGWYVYIKDQVGTIYKVWDHNAKAIADDRTYDSFGNLVSQTGTTKTPLGFQGKYFDQESGLNYFYHRYYNPSIGRFMSEDPIGVGGGLNIFRFGDNDPVNLKDPFGLVIGGFNSGFDEEGPSRTYNNSFLAALSCENQNGKWFPRFLYTVTVTTHLQNENHRNHEFIHFKVFMYYYLAKLKSLEQAEGNAFSSYCECMKFAMKNEKLGKSPFSWLMTPSIFNLFDMFHNELYDVWENSFQHNYWTNYL